jgi:hypothetical protein
MISNTEIMISRKDKHIRVRVERLYLAGVQLPDASGERPPGERCSGDENL